jgi:orotidine-5'-phosphate decarboxylase
VKNTSPDTFSDRLHASIKRANSLLVAGIDPIIETFPEFIIKEAHAKCVNDSEAVVYAIKNFYISALFELHKKIAAIKPNMAFFEQYGLAGLRALSYICDEAKNLDLPIILDAKRGDIGSTAKAYSNAYLGKAKYFSQNKAFVDCDALTVNPFLGFDTIKVFLDDCLEYGKGLFILVKTSNPGSNDLQDLIFGNDSLSSIVAKWVEQNANTLQGQNGLSGLGAVVGATHPEQIVNLRKQMSKSFFLIPGFGAQGGSASDAIKGCIKVDGIHSGAIINASRAIFSDISSELSTWDELRILLTARVDTFNEQIKLASSCAK